MREREEWVKHNLPIYTATVPLPPSLSSEVQNRKIFLSIFQKSRPPAKKKESGKFFGFWDQPQAGAEAERKIKSKVFLEKSSSFVVNVLTQNKNTLQ